MKKFDTFIPNIYKEKMFPLLFIGFLFVVVSILLQISSQQISFKQPVHAAPVAQTACALAGGACVSSNICRVNCVPNPNVGFPDCSNQYGCPTGTVCCDPAGPPIIPTTTPGGQYSCAGSCLQYACTDPRNGPGYVAAVGTCPSGKSCCVFSQQGTGGGPPSGGNACQNAACGDGWYCGQTCGATGFADSLYNCVGGKQVGVTDHCGCKQCKIGPDVCTLDSAGKPIPNVACGFSNGGFPQSCENQGGFCNPKDSTKPYNGCPNNVPDLNGQNPSQSIDIPYVCQDFVTGNPNSNQQCCAVPSSIGTNGPPGYTTPTACRGNQGAGVCFWDACPDGTSDITDPNALTYCQLYPPIGNGNGTHCCVYDPSKSQTNNCTAYNAGTNAIESGICRFPGTCSTYSASDAGQGSCPNNYTCCTTTTVSPSTCTVSVNGQTYNGACSKNQCNDLNSISQCTGSNCSAFTDSGQKTTCVTGQTCCYVPKQTGGGPGGNPPASSICNDVTSGNSGFCYDSTSCKSIGFGLGVDQKCGSQSCCTWPQGSPGGTPTICNDVTSGNSGFCYDSTSCKSIGFGLGVDQKCGSQSCCTWPQGSPGGNTCTHYKCDVEGGVANDPNNSDDAFQANVSKITNNFHCDAGSSDTSTKSCQPWEYCKSGANACHPLKNCHCDNFNEYICLDGGNEHYVNYLQCPDTKACSTDYANKNGGNPCGPKNTSHESCSIDINIQGTDYHNVDIGVCNFNAPDGYTLVQATKNCSSIFDQCNGPLNVCQSSTGVYGYCRNTDFTDKCGTGFHEDSNPKTSCPQGKFKCCVQ